MIWDELTTLDFERIDRNIPVLLVTAATEQHGPHLPLATDRLIGEHFARSLHEKIPDDILILPVMSVGCSDHHMDFLGSLTLSHGTFMNQVEDMVRSVIHHGFTNIVLLNSHGGNQAINQVLVEKLGNAYPGVQIVMVTWWKLGGTELGSLNEGGAMSTGHAGEFETSLMLLIAPHLVRKDAYEKGKHSKTFQWAEGDMLHPPKVALYRSIKKMTSNGVYGDPTYASRAKGSEITELVLENLQRIVLDLKDAK